FRYRLSLSSIFDFQDRIRSNSVNGIVAQAEGGFQYHFPILGISFFYPILSTAPLRHCAIAPTPRRRPLEYGGANKYVGACVSARKTVKARKSTPP
ncbi:MAG: hypothetical protein OXF43_05205, partial [Gammaproteobacteria bacterium]|nr:hypothetical protein [Gammaproteobacteria bacterium]